VHLCPAFSRLFATVLRGFRALLWSALIATAQAQFVPPVTRRSETACPEVETPASPQAEITAAIPSPSSVSPQSTPNRLPPPSHDFAANLFKYLEEPEPETQPLRDSITPYAGLVISDGQVIELTSDLYASLGTGPGQISWAGSGGFNAYLHDTIVRLNGSTAPVIWGVTDHFIGADDVLIFGSTTPGATVIWDTKIDLGGGEHTIRVIDNIADRFRTTVRFDQGFSNGDLVFEGVGIADLSAANDDWHGSLTVNEAEVHANLDASLRGLYFITVEHGGKFVIDNLGSHSSWLGGHYLENRLSQFISIYLDSGTLAYWGQKKGHSRERTGIIELLGGANVIDVTNHRPGQSSVLTIGGLYRNTGATLNLTNSHTNGGSFGTGGNTPQLKFRDRAGPWAMPELEGGIIPWATVNGEHFATIKGKHLVAYPNYYTGKAHTWNAKHNASLTTHQTLTADRSINSLRLSQNGALTLGENTKLTLNAGALLSTGGKGNQVIAGGELVTPKPELFAHVFKGNLSISSDIRQTSPNNANGISLVKSGDGTLTLSGKDLSALRGNHYVHEGTLLLDRQGDGLGLSGHLFVGGGRRETVLELHQGAQLQDSASITLRGSRITDGIAPNHYNTRLTLYSVEQYLDSLSIEGASMLEFREYTSPDNLIGFDHILMADAASELLISGWDQLTKHLLIRRSSEAEVAQYLGQIKFEDYDATAKLIDYDSNYFEIVPTWFNGVPEPGTTGALLGGGALGFFAWRRRRVANK